MVLEHHKHCFHLQAGSLSVEHTSIQTFPLKTISRDRLRLDPMVETDQSYH